MIEIRYLLSVLVIFQASCNSIRLLADNTDNCAKYKFMDSQGNSKTQDCNACQKVC